MLKRDRIEAAPVEVLTSQPLAAMPMRVALRLECLRMAVDASRGGPPLHPDDHIAAAEAFRAYLTKGQDEDAAPAPSG